MVQAIPGFDFARDFLLEAIHRRVLLPFYKHFCGVPFDQNSPYKPIQLECLLSFAFVALNRPSLESERLACAISVSGINRKGRLITHEHLEHPLSSLFYPNGNLSFKTFLRVAQQSPEITVSLVKQILMERKVILISPENQLHHMRRNAIFIETILELLTPILQVREVYMIIAYLKDEMVDYLDSPVPYIIGMSDSQWEKFGKLKWK